MSLSVKDSAAVNQVLKTTLDTGEHVTHHKIDGTVAVSGPVTDAQIRATPLPVSGPLTDAQLRATAVPVDFSAFPASGVDAFNRLRVSAPGYRFDSQLTYQIDSDLWDSRAVFTGSITHNGTNRWAVLDAPAAGDSAVLQSHYHAPYTPGRGQLAFITFRFGATPGSGAIRRVGYYDGTNGLYLKHDSSGVSLVLASGTTSGDEAVAQADWNIDPMTDGSGPSGLTLDFTKVQILVIQTQALYVGRVTVGFDIGGMLHPVHAFDCANESAYPYIQQASLPVRYEVGTSSAACSMEAICASVISEGGNDIQNMAGREFSADMGVTELDVDQVEIPVISIQVAAQLNSINQNAVVIPLAVEVSVSGQPILVRVRRNATLTGASFSAVSATESVVNSDVASTAVSGGRVIDSFYIQASNTLRSSAERGLAGKTLLCYRHLATAAGDILTVTAQGTSADNASVLASIKWKEIR
jgi:hypothetical protein